MSDVPPLIVTLALDPDTSAWLDALRRAHFPSERNVVPGHITLFHALPGALEPQVAERLAALTASASPFPAAFPGLRFLGRGVALRVESPELAAVRGRLAQQFADHLTPQDAQGYRPHATLQNKVSPDEARATMARLQTTFAPRTGQVDGLDLWRYRGGPWEAAGTFRFGAA